MKIFISHIYSDTHTIGIECDNFKCEYRDSIGACNHRPLNLKITRNATICLLGKEAEEKE